MKLSLKGMTKLLLAVGGVVIAVFVLLSAFASTVIQEKLSQMIPEVSKQRPAKLLSCFFGLDNTLPQNSRSLWRDAPGKDGMPVVFSHELDTATLRASAFTITKQNGEQCTPGFVTLRLANEEFELRTVLLIGEFGTYPGNQPVRLDITADLKTCDGQNLRGDSIAITPLEAGPFLSYAEWFVIDEKYPFVRFWRGCDCPKKVGSMVVRTVWAGGVRAMDGKELGERDYARFWITLVRNADTVRVHPVRIADVDDNDNNIDLCIQEAGTPLWVEVEARTAIDPRNDANPWTRVRVVSRW
jgi:hypothetical protein